MTDIQVGPRADCGAVEGPPRCPEACFKIRKGSLTHAWRETTGQMWSPPVGTHAKLTGRPVDQGVRVHSGVLMESHTERPSEQASIGIDCNTSHHHLSRSCKAIIPCNH